MLRIVLSIGLMAAASLGGVAARADTEPSPGEGVRRTTDAPDATAPGECHCTHLIYFVPADGADDSLDVDGTLAGSIRAIRTWFGTQMQQAPRVDRVGTSDTEDITFVRGRNPAATYASLRVLIAELSDRGFNEPGKRYLVYAGLDRGTVCGESTYGNPLLPGATYAAVYLDSTQCGARDLGGQGRADATATHEWLHAEGLVQVGAPRHCPTSPYHVCTVALHLVASVTGIRDPEHPDILYPYVDTRLSAKVLDRGRDDYLDHGLPVVHDLRRSAYLEAA